MILAGKAAADALAIAAGERPTDPELEDFGGNDLAEEDVDQDPEDVDVFEDGGDGPPAPPPMPANRSSEPPPAPPPQSLIDLGDPPTDPLAAQEWLHRAMILSAADAAVDHKISARERRKELRTISTAAAKLLPHARLYQAEQLIKRDRLELETRQRARSGAQLERRPTASNVIPIRPKASGEPSK